MTSLNRDLSVDLLAAAHQERDRAAHTKTTGKRRFFSEFWELKILLWGIGTLPIAYGLAYATTWGRNAGWF